MNAVDILLLIVAATGGVIGFTKGLLSQVGQIAGVVAGIISARLLGDTLTGLFAGDAPPTALETVCGFGAAFLLAYFLTWLVSRMARGIIRTVHLGIIDHLAGAAFKIAQWLLILSLAINFYILISGDDDRLHQQDKPWRDAVVDFAPAVLGYLSEVGFNKDHSPDVNK